MSNAALDRRLPDLSLRQVGWVALFLNIQLVAVLAYYHLLEVSITQPRYTLYGLLWVNLGLLVLYKTTPPSGLDFRTRRRSLAIAAGYFGLLVALGGLVGTGVPEQAGGLRIAWLPPGWGPAIVYASPLVVIAITPAFLIGYLALAYLVYVTLLDAAGSAVAGVVGLFSCVSCTWPILAAVASSLLGGAGVLGATALNASYDLSTAVFIVTVALLYWRPGIR